MTYSDKLNGFWEEGYHYYLEFRNDTLTVRDYRRSIMLRTTVTYDAAALESGQKTEIIPADRVLSRTAVGEMMTMIKELHYDNGALILLYYYTILGEKTYTLHKVDHGPFDHIRIRDDEFLPMLQGRWEMWSKSGDSHSFMLITGSLISCFGMENRPFHAVSFNYSPDKVYLVPANLTDNDFGAFTRVEVLPDMLTTTMMVCDMSCPLSVFARKEMLDKITVPPDALRPAVCTMLPPDNTFIPMKIPEPVPQSASESPKACNANPMFCPECGYRLPQEAPLRFCPECGREL